MSDKVIAYKPFFFKEINTREKEGKTRDRIFNLDEFHTIQRNGNSVSATTYNGEDQKLVYIAHCNNEDGARWVMDCVMRRQTTTEESVLSVEENGYDDTQAYF